MKSNADFWINDTHDGRWWHTIDSKHKGFTDVRKGERTFATCHGAYVCNNNECTKWFTEKVGIDFRQAKGGDYTCKSCGYYVEREYCGALKAVKFEYNSQTITIMHQGRHKYPLKQTTRANWNMHRNKPLTETYRNLQGN